MSEISTARSAAANPSSASARVEAIASTDALSSDRRPSWAPSDRRDAVQRWSADDNESSPLPPGLDGAVHPPTSAEPGSRPVQPAAVRG